MLNILLIFSFLPTDIGIPITINNKNKTFCGVIINPTRAQIIYPKDIKIKPKTPNRSFPISPGVDDSTLKSDNCLENLACTPNRDSNSQTMNIGISL